MSGGGVSAWLARCAVRLAGVIAPSAERDRLVREWRAELWHARKGGLRGAALVAFGLGALHDARALRAIGGSHGGVWGVGSATAAFATDLRLAARSLLRTPGVSSVAVVTIGLGLGGTTAIATLLDRIVIRPLPYPAAERLVQLENEVPGVADGTVWGMSTAQYVFLDEESSSLEAVGLYRAFGGNLGLDAGPVRASGWRVTPELIELLGGRAALGRTFLPRDGEPDAPPVIVLSDGFWRSAFGADPSVISSRVVVRGEPIEIVGVLEPGFGLPGARAERSQVYTPIRIDRAGRFYNSHVFRMVGRLAQGATAQVAADEMRETLPRLIERFPLAYGESFFERYGFRPRTTDLKAAVVGGVGRNLWILFGGVGLVLLIAVANAANLFVFRVEESRRDLAVRSALGAGRWALIRHLLAVSLALTTTGAVLALVIAHWGVPALVALAPESLPRADGLALTGGAVVFTVGASALVALALALYPIASQLGAGVTRGTLLDTRGASSGRRKQRVRGTLVAAQVALALMLAAGAGLLIKSVAELRGLDPGFVSAGGMTVDVYLEPARYDGDVAVWQAQRQILERLRVVPGVRDAGFGTALPLSGGFGCTVQGFEDQRVYERIGEGGLTTCAGQTFVTPGYFKAMGIAALRGRAFEDQDNDDPARASVVVSRAFADRFFAGQDAIGEGVAPSGRTEGPFYRVIGVVDDVPSATMDGPPAMAIYYPMVQDPNTPGNWGSWGATAASLAVSTTLDDPLSLLSTVRRVVSDVDPAAAVTNPSRLEDLVHRSMARVTFITTLLQIAAAVALALSAVGIYGVMSYAVERRTREIGTRLALGARPHEVRRRIVLRSASVASLGLAAGLALSLATGGVLESLLYGVSPADPVVLAAATLLIGSVALLASWMPALKVSAIDPVEALRSE